MGLTNSRGGGAAVEVSVYDNEVERLCAYLKNDSLIRWHLGCDQEAIDRARAHLARRRQPIENPHIPHYNGNGVDREDIRTRKRAEAGSAAYLQAIRQAAANG